jgi:serine/threonine protein kinase
MLPCIINRMLEKDPEKRISSKDLLTELTKLDSKNLTKNIGIIVRSFLLIKTNLLLYFKLKQSMI